MSIGTDWVAHHAEATPEAFALGDGVTGQRWHWAELESRVARLAGLLRGLGVGPGERVALLCDGSPRVFELQFACMRLSAVFVPLNWRLAVPELIEVCQDAAPLVMISDATWDQVARQVVAGAGIAHRITVDCPDGPLDYEAGIQASEPVAPVTVADDTEPTHLLYTSGTTGRPKGALSTRRTLIWQSINAAHTSRVAEPAGHHLNPMPLFHAGGLHALANPILYFGGGVTVLPRFVPDQVLALMDQLPVTHFNAIPLFYSQMCRLPQFDEADLSSLRCCVVAGAVASDEVVRRWTGRGVPLQPQYGSTETGPLVTALRNPEQAVDMIRSGSAGTAAPHVEIRLVDPEGADVPTGSAGEIWVRGPSITPTYWKLGREPHFQGDWLRTGDVGQVDAAGHYRILGRIKEMYKSGGENVYFAEVERVLAEFPEITDLAVAAVPDPHWDEVGVVVAVPRPGVRVTLEAIREFGAQRLARYKLPRGLLLVDELPRNVTGKVSRAQIRELYLAGAAQPTTVDPDPEGTAIRATL